MGQWPEGERERGSGREGRKVSGLVWRARRSSLPEQEFQRLGACLPSVVGAEAES